MKPSLATLVTLALALGVAHPACIGATPPQRLATPTAVALLVHLESADGDARDVPADVVAELTSALAARNLVAARVPADVLGDRRTSEQRLAAVAGASDAPWVVMVEARARFFSQLSGRYRWEVELRTSFAARGEVELAQHNDLSVAAFLLFEHERETDALAFVRRQVVDEVTELVDRVLASSASSSSSSSGDGH